MYTSVPLFFHRTVGMVTGPSVSSTFIRTLSSSSSVQLSSTSLASLSRRIPSSSSLPSSSSSSSSYTFSLVRSLFVKVHGPNASRDLERLQLKVDASGIERRLSSRKRFIKPHLVRQQNIKNAVYTKAKNERIKLVEEMMLDRSISGL